MNNKTYLIYIIIQVIDRKHTYYSGTLHIMNIGRYVRM